MRDALDGEPLGQKFGRDNTQLQRAKGPAFSRIPPVAWTGGDDAVAGNIAYRGHIKL